MKKEHGEGFLLLFLSFSRMKTGDGCKTNLCK
jgi:hypothetical protein